MFGSGMRAVWPKVGFLGRDQLFGKRIRSFGKSLRFGRTLATPELGRRDAIGIAKGPVERADTAETSLQRERQDRKMSISRIAQTGRNFGKPESIEEGVEVPEPELVVNHQAQARLGHSQVLGQVRDGEASYPVQPFVGHRRADALGL